jgi:hypothetical protein
MTIVTRALLGVQGDGRICESTIKTMHRKRAISNQLRIVYSSRKTNNERKNGLRANLPNFVISMAIRECIEKVGKQNERSGKEGINCVSCTAVAKQTTTKKKKKKKSANALPIVPIQKA